MKSPAIASATRRRAGRPALASHADPPRADTVTARCKKPRQPFNMTTPLPTQPVGSFNHVTGLWTLRELWRCALSNGRVLYVAPGFESDGASIPRFLWRAVGPRYDARTFPAALCHDALYASELVDRGQADAELYRLLRGFGVWNIKALAYWRAVRSCGWVPWMQHTEASIADARRYCVLRRGCYGATAGGG